MQDISIRELKKKEIFDALPLVWKVFNKFEASDYSQEGIDEFHKSIYDHD